jgi:hypothetical protein
MLTCAAQFRSEALADEPLAIPTLGGMKESWEDEEDEALKELQMEAAINEKLNAMPKPAKEDKVKAAPKKVTKAAPEVHRDLTPEEKLARLEAEKKSDYENARDLFDGLDDAKQERYVLNDQTFDNFKPKSERDFEDFSNFLAGKITPFQVRHPRAKQFFPSTRKTIFSFKFPLLWCLRPFFPTPPSFSFSLRIQIFAEKYIVY